MRRPSVPVRPSERGVALLIVLVVLFIVAVLMVDITLTATTARRAARNASDAFLMDAAVDARLQVGLALLKYDLASNDVDGGDDRWALPKYTDVEGQAPEDAAADTEKREEEGAAVQDAGDSANIQVKLQIEDEERKFNLLLLLHPDAKIREASRTRFAVLLDRYREDTPLDISRTRADELRDKVVEYLERAAPGASEKGKFPVPKTGNWRIVTSDELRYVEGFEDPTHGLTAEGLLYEARDPRAVREHMADPEAGDEPESFPGLLKYLTVWSGGVGAEKGDPSKIAPENWARMRLVNVNTAEKPVLETLFWEHTGDMTYAERIVEYRGSPKDGSESTGTGGGATGSDAPEEHQYFQKLEDLKKVDGLEQEILDRNSIRADTVTLESRVFSLDLHAEMDRASLQVRHVVQRHSKGFQTILREARADPVFKKEGEGDEADLPPER